VYLDAKTDTYLEEVSSCNIFVRKGKTIKTPPLSGTILPGERQGIGAVSSNKAAAEAAVDLAAAAVEAVEALLCTWCVATSPSE
jgi:branched-chain amino acid aminotransferase